MSNFALRVPDHVMAQAKAAAEEDNVSINQMLVAFIAQGLGQRNGMKMLQERARRANIDLALKLLDEVPDVEPEPGDERPAKRKSRQTKR